MIQIEVPTIRCDCDALLRLKVCHSFAGYYLGYFCPNCGPYSRESGYYRTHQEAQQALHDYLKD